MKKFALIFTVLAFLGMVSLTSCKQKAAETETTEEMAPEAEATVEETPATVEEAEATVEEAEAPVEEAEAH